MAEAAALKALHPEDGQAEIAADPGVVGQVVQLFLGAGESEKGPVGHVAGAVDALDAQVGRGEQIDGALDALRG